MKKLHISPRCISEVPFSLIFYCKTSHFTDKLPIFKGLFSLEAWQPQSCRRREPPVTQEHIVFKRKAESRSPRNHDGSLMRRNSSAFAAASQGCFVPASPTMMTSRFISTSFLPMPFTCASSSAFLNGPCS